MSVIVKTLTGNVLGWFNLNFSEGSIHHATVEWIAAKCFLGPGIGYLNGAKFTNSANKVVRSANVLLFTPVNDITLMPRITKLQDANLIEPLIFH